MSEQAMEHAGHGHTETVDPHFGTASDGKVGMWIFLLTDAMSFSGLLLGYGILRAGSHDWPNPSERLGIPSTAVMTFALICSSVSMVLALEAAKMKDSKGLQKWLLATIGGGAFFLLGQVREYTNLIREGHVLSQDQFMSTFYSVTGFHGMHVFTGVCYLTAIYLGARKGKYAHGDDYNMVEICGLFWHFVDLVWILVFTFVYLIQ
jgi:heme/copper-type cytochrome/quinol oxidase subunit 3